MTYWKNDDGHDCILFSWMYKYGQYCLGAGLFPVSLNMTNLLVIVLLESINSTHQTDCINWTWLLYSNTQRCYYYEDFSHFSMTNVNSLKIYSGKKNITFKIYSVLLHSFFFQQKNMFVKMNCMKLTTCYTCVYVKDFYCGILIWQHCLCLCSFIMPIWCLMSFIKQKRTTFCIV